MAGFEQIIAHPELNPRLNPNLPQPPPGGLAGVTSQSAATAGMALAGAALPGYMTSMSNIGTNIASKTAGQVPDDVIALLKQQGAERNVSTGAASNAAYLRALGQTSLGLEEQGQKDLESILPSIPGYSISQGPEFQQSANLQYEGQLQQDVFNRQEHQQNIAFQQQMQALEEAKKGVGAGGGGSTISWGAPTNAWSGPGGVDALGFANDNYTAPDNLAQQVVYGPGGGPNSGGYYAGSTDLSQYEPPVAWGGGDFGDF